MDIKATCGCGAQITLTPGRPNDLGNGHGYASNNNATVDAERAAVAEAFGKWVEAHAACTRSARITYPPYQTGQADAALTE